MGIRWLSAWLFAALLTSSGLGEFAHRLSHHFQETPTALHHHDAWCAWRAALASPPCHRGGAAENATAKKETAMGTAVPERVCPLGSMLGELEDFARLALVSTSTGITLTPLDSAPIPRPMPPLPHLPSRAALWPPVRGPPPRAA